MNFVNWFSGVYNSWLNGLLLDDWLDVLVNVVVDMLACNGRVGSRAMLGLSNCASILELSGLGCETLLDMRVVTVLDMTVFSLVVAVRVFFGENLTMLNGLNGGVVVVLVNLTIYGVCDVFVVSTGNILVLNRWVDSLRSQFGSRQRADNEIPRGRWYRAFHPWRGSCQQLPLLFPF
jgi:hypothetical protein